jgi:DNA-binding PadR family transcriptional regulator
MDVQYCMANQISIQTKQTPRENYKQVQAQILKGLRYMIVLHLLKMKPTHGYGIISVIRKKFGIYLGPSSVYPILNDLEAWGYIESTWNFAHFRPRKVFTLTNQGQTMLSTMEHSVGHILRGLGIAGTPN